MFQGQIKHNRSPVMRTSDARPDLHLQHWHIFFLFLAFFLTH